MRQQWGRRGHWEGGVGRVLSERAVGRGGGGGGWGVGGEAAHLNIADCSVQGTAPVDQAVLPVDEALLVQPDKGLLHSAHQVVIHGECQPVPVHADAHAPHLPKDLATIGFHPGKHLLQERIPACSDGSTDLMCVLQSECVCGLSR